MQSTTPRAAKKKGYTPQKVDTQVFSKALWVGWQEIDDPPGGGSGRGAAGRHPPRQVRSRALLHLGRTTQPHGEVHHRGRQTPPLPWASLCMSWPGALFIAAPNPPPPPPVHGLCSPGLAHEPNDRTRRRWPQASVPHPAVRVRGLAVVCPSANRRRSTALPGRPPSSAEKEGGGRGMRRAPPPPPPPQAEPWRPGFGGDGRHIEGTRKAPAAAPMGRCSSRSVRSLDLAIGQTGGVGGGRRGSRTRSGRSGTEVGAGGIRKRGAFARGTPTGGRGSGGGRTRDPQASGSWGGGGGAALSADHARVGCGLRHIVVTPPSLCPVPKSLRLHEMRPNERRRANRSPQILRWAPPEPPHIRKCVGDVGARRPPRARGPRRGA